jgi:hypothetical protein
VEHFFLRSLRADEHNSLIRCVTVRAPVEQRADAAFRPRRAARETPESKRF